jgi:hypothetical protein
VIIRDESTGSASDRGFELQFLFQQKDLCDPRLRAPRSRRECARTPKPSMTSGLWRSESVVVPLRGSAKGGDAENVEFVGTGA